MSKLSSQGIKQYLEEASKKTIENILNARNGKEELSTREDFCSTVIKEESVKGQRVKSSVLFYPVYCNDRNKDTVFLSEIHAHKDTYPPYSEEEAHYTYVKIKGIEKASLSTTTELSEKIDEITNADVEIKEFRNALKKIGVSGIDRIVSRCFNKLDDVISIEHMTYEIEILNQEIVSAGKKVVLYVAFEPIDSYSLNRLESFNSYIVTLETTCIEVTEELIGFDKSKVLDVADADNPLFDDIR